MKAKTLCAAAALSAALVPISCNRNAAPSSSLQEGERCEVTVRVGSPVKVSGVSGLSSLEAQVKTLQVLVFRDGWLEAYGSSQEQSSLTLSCTAGERDVYAIVNGEDCSEVLGVDELLHKRFSLGHKVTDDHELAFTMSGSLLGVTLPSSEDVIVPVSRLVSRVEVDNVSLNYLSEAFASQTFSLDSIYLVRAAGDATIDADAASVILNPDGFVNAGERETWLTSEVVGKTIVDKSSDATRRYFYTMPREAGEGQTTLLVLSARIGDRRFWYPLELGTLEPNCSYRISDIEIRRPGSNAPDSPVSFEDVQFGVSVQPWTEVTLEDDNFRI